jgi:glycosyltransferase involved in cell wall biosynthesis
VLDHGRLGRLVPPGDAQALAAAIEAAATNRDQWNGLTPPARQHIERHFAPEAAMQRLEELFVRLV